MTTKGQEISRARRLGAAASMAAAATLVAGAAIHRFDGIDGILLAVAAAMGFAALGFTRTSLVAQVLSRGTAWIVLLPSGLASLFALMRGERPALEFAGIALATGLALLLARPMLHSRQARERFAPRAFRGWFIAGSTASVATGLAAAVVAVDSLSYDGLKAAGFGALSASLFASAIGVVRMRAWGVILGALTSLALLATAGLASRHQSLVLALAAMPSLSLHLFPILLARVRRATTAVRVASPVASPAGGPRVADAPTDDHRSLDLLEDAEPELDRPRSALRP